MSSEPLRGVRRNVAAARIWHEPHGLYVKKDMDMGYMGYMGHMGGGRSQRVGFVRSVSLGMPSCPSLSGSGMTMR